MTENWKSANTLMEPVGSPEDAHTQDDREEKGASGTELGLLFGGIIVNPGEINIIKPFQPTINTSIPAAPSRENI